MAQPILEIENLHKKFKDVEVLKGVDLALETGDVVSIIGSSGSGKTTLLRCVNMLEEFHQGRILIDGEEIGYSGPHHKARRESEIARQRAMTGRRRPFGARWADRPKSLAPSTSSPT